MVADVLSLSNVFIDYDKTDVVFDVSFDVKPGEVFGLVGLNGVGKTTLIKSILGLKRNRVGDVSLFGTNVNDKNAKKNLVYLPERFEPPWFLTGIEFVKFSMKLYSQPASEDKIINAAIRLGLDEKALSRRVQSYSKGMRQKLGIIATVLSGCSLIILDEPMSGLDPLARSLVKDMLMGLKNDNQTLFICSHLLADLDDMCDRIAVMHDGRVDFCASPADLKNITKKPDLEHAFLHYIQTKKVS